MNTRDSAPSVITVASVHPGKYKKDEILGRSSVGYFDHWKGRTWRLGTSWGEGIGTKKQSPGEKIQK